MEELTTVSTWHRRSEQDWCDVLVDYSFADGMSQGSEEEHGRTIVIYCKIPEAFLDHGAEWFLPQREKAQKTSDGIPLLDTDLKDLLLQMFHDNVEPISKR